MKRATHFKHFWVLLRLLALPVGIVKWLLYACGVLFILGLVAIYFFDNPVLMALSTSLVVLYLFLLVFMSPATILTMVTSKQFSMLSYLRRSLFIVLVIFITLAASMIPVAVLMKGGATDLVSISLLSFLIASCFVFGLIYLLSLWSNAYWVIFLPIMGITPLVKALIDLPWPILLFPLVLIWGLFAHWWFRWKPKSFFTNVMALSQSEMLKRDPFIGVKINRTFSFFTQPKNIIDSFLLGGADSKLSVFLRGFWIVLVLSLAYLGVNIFFGFSAEPSALKKLWASQIVLLVILGSCNYLAVHVFRNVKALWIYFPETRTEVFNRIEMLNYRAAMLTSIIPLAAGLVVVLSLEHLSFSPLQFIWSTLFGGVFGFTCFYMNLVFYALKGPSLMWLAWAPGLLTSAAMALWGVTFWFYSDDSFRSQVWLGLIATIGFMLVYTMRSWARKRWNRINFVGVKS